MNRIKLKYFITIFFVLMVIQFLIGLADVLLSQSHNELSSISGILITLFSFPISLINSNLPFFAQEELYMLGIYWIINVIIQAIVVYVIILIIKKIRQSN
ncbi:hypothetical protein [Winogradskyella ludwigii]|uniref:hypothetical protein n=1 Tax=Winogradskyella ludwigii TaxID=2686076 RepID=UPI0015C7C781|nr:hypothetical protein [Winogradskyella ludwigii]